MTKPIHFITHKFNGKIYTLTCHQWSVLLEKHGIYIKECTLLSRKCRGLTNDKIFAAENLPNRRNKPVDQDTKDRILADPRSAVIAARDYGISPSTYRKIKRNGNHPSIRAHDAWKAFCL